MQHATARTISVLYGTTWQGGFAHTTTAILTKTGDFRLVMLAPAEVVLHSAEGYAPLALAPGNAVQLHFDALRPELTLRLEGRGAAANIYLNQAYQQSNRDDEAGRPPTSLWRGSRPWWPASLLALTACICVPTKSLPAPWPRPTGCKAFRRTGSLAAMAA